MSHGGKRNGSGRRKGAAAKKTREVADRAAAEGITPLEVMLEAMRAKHGAGDLDGAAEIAKDAAPYMHARMSSVTVDAKVGLRKEIVEELVDGDGSGNGAPDGSPPSGTAGVPPK